MSRENKDEKTSKNTLKRLDIARLIHREIGLNSTESAELVGRVFSEMSKSLTSGEDVKLAGFGTFKLRQKKARLGRNPKTGQECMITPRQVVTFKPSIALRERVASSLATEADILGSGEPDINENLRAPASTLVRGTRALDTGPLETEKGRPAVAMASKDWTSLFELLGTFAFDSSSSTERKWDIFFKSILELKTIIDPSAAITKDSLSAWVATYQSSGLNRMNADAILSRFKQNLVALQDMPHKSDVIFVMVNIAIVDNDYDHTDKTLVTQAILDWDMPAKVVSDIEYVCPEIVQLS